MKIEKKPREKILAFKNEGISVILEMTSEQLAEQSQSYLRNPENYRPVKKKICMYLNADILE